MKNGKLNGKVAVVTGRRKESALASQNISPRKARLWWSITHLSKDGADKVVDEISKRGGKAIAVQGEVAKKKDIERLFAERKKHLARSTFWLTTPEFTSSCHSKK